MANAPGGNAHGHSLGTEKGPGTDDRRHHRTLSKGGGPGQRAKGGINFDEKEKVLEMEGAQNVEVLTDLTGDELEILDPYGAELVTYGICYETLSNTIHKLAELLNEENMEV